MAHDERNWNRLPRPGVPFINVQVGAADPCQQHTNQYVIDSQLGHGNLFKPQTSFKPALYDRFHARLILPASPDFNRDFYHYTTLASIPTKRPSSGSFRTW